MKIGSFLHRSLNTFQVLAGTGTSHCMDACCQTTRHAVEHEYMHNSGTITVGGGGSGETLAVPSVMWRHCVSKDGNTYMPNDITELCHKASLINSKINLSALSAIYNSFQNVTSKVLKPAVQSVTRPRSEQVDDWHTDLWQGWRLFRYCVWKESWAMSEKGFLPLGVRPRRLKSKLYFI
jgi:hypothetical protein